MVGEYQMPPRPPEEPRKPKKVEQPERPKTLLGKIGFTIRGAVLWLIWILGYSLFHSSFSITCKDRTSQIFFPFANQLQTGCQTHGGALRSTFTLFIDDPKLYWTRVVTVSLVITGGLLIGAVGTGLFRLYVLGRARTKGQSFEQSRSEVEASIAIKKEKIEKVLPGGDGTVPLSFIRKLILFIVVPVALLLIAMVALMALQHP